MYDYHRPVQSHMTYDFWKLNKPDTKTWVEVLSNRPFYRGKKASLNQPNFIHKVDSED